MLILIDGYNVIAPVAPPNRVNRRGWLRAERQLLIDRLLIGLDPRLVYQTCVVFDAAVAPPGAESHLRIQGLEIRFAVDHDEADDLIEELLLAHPAAKRLSLITSDRRLQAAAKRVGAQAFDAQVWLDSLLDGRVLLAIDWPPRSDAIVRDAARWPAGDADSGSKPTPHPAAELDWLEHFGITKAELAEWELQSEPTVPPRADDNSRHADRIDPDAGRPPGRISSRELPEGFNPFPKGYGEDLLDQAPG
jgi:predicted RNA-binding protein with PIN domain